MTPCAGTLRYFRTVAAHVGIATGMVDMSNAEDLPHLLHPSTRLVWLESPTNPLLTVTDIAAVCASVRQTCPDAIVAVDGTFMSPYFQRPLQLGADLVVHSVTKYINGHSDVTMGCAATNSDAIARRLADWQVGECETMSTSISAVGALPSPFDCHLVRLGVRTLHVRMRAHAANGRRVAEWLESESKSSTRRVERVLYPALPSHPQHHLHIRQTTGMSGMVSFYLRGGLAQSRTFLTALRVFTLAESLGGVESLAELP